MEIPRAPLERIMRQAGAERVSEGAVEALRESVEEVAEAVAGDAVGEADGDDRSSIRRQDVQAASR